MSGFVFWSFDEYLLLQYNEIEKKPVTKINNNKKQINDNY